MIPFRAAAPALLAALALVFLGMGSSAQAQAPCTGAPGEQMVAVKTEPGGATVPLCIPGAAPGAPPPPRPRWRKAPTPPSHIMRTHQISGLTGDIPGQAIPENASRSNNATV